MMNRFRTWGIVICGTCLIAAAGCTSTVGRNWTTGHRVNVDDELTAQLSLARINERQGQAEQARNVYNAVLKRDPNNQMAYHRLGVMAAREARMQEAEAHFRKAAEVAPPTAELLNDMGYNFYLQDRLSEAESSFRAALQQNPHHQRANNNLGLVLGETGRTDESLATFRRVVSESEAQSNLAYARTQAGDLRSAEAHYHRAIALDSSQRKPAEALLQLAGMKSAVERAQVAQARLQDHPADAYATESRSANQGRLAQVAYEQHEVTSADTASPAARTRQIDDPRSGTIYRPEALAALHSRSEDSITVSNSKTPPAEKPEAATESPTSQKSLFGGGFLALHNTHRPSPAHDVSGESESTSAQSPAPGSSAVLASFSDTAPPQANLANSRRALHVVEPGKRSSQQLSPLTAFDRSKLGAPADSSRLPSLNQRMPTRVTSTKAESEVVPTDVPMQGPPSALRSSRRTRNQEKPSTQASNATSPAAGASAMSPWQQPTWTAGSTGSLQVPSSNEPKPHAISNPFASGGFFGANQPASPAQTN